MTDQWVTVWVSLWMLMWMGVDDSSAAAGIRYGLVNAARWTAYGARRLTRWHR